LWDSIIKLKFGAINKYVYALFLCLLILVALLLMKEYRFFYEQTNQMIELQKEYRNYILTLRQYIDENEVKSQDLNGSEKKKLDEKKKPFIVVNRRPEHLRQSLVKYLQDKKLQSKEFQHFLPKKKKTKIAKPDKLIITRRRVTKIFDSLADFIWPLNAGQFYISSFYGYRKLRGRTKFHSGIDLATVRGTAVKSVGGGIVKEACYLPGYGNTVVIWHNKKYKTRYAHLDSIKVKLGQKISRGDKIGTVGSTGHVVSKRGRDASHLHFEVYALGKHINPLHVLP